METLREHSYSKPWEQDESLTKGEEAMDTTPIANADDIIVNVTQLDKNSDTFESLLLELLKSHSRFQPCHYRDNELQITPESLDTMSMGQIQRLLTSSSVNYEAIQRLLKIKLERSRGPSPDVKMEMSNSSEQCNTVGSVSEIPGHTPSPSGTAGIANGSLESCSTSSLTSMSSNSSSTIANGPTDNPIPTTTTTTATTSDSNTGSSSNPTTTSSSTESPSPRTPSISIKISPDQLKHLQSQIAEVFRQQNLQLPEGLSAEQKQIVLNSLIAQQLNASLQQLIPGATLINSQSSNNASSPGNKGNIGGMSVGASSSAEPTNTTSSPLNKSIVSTGPPVTSVGTPSLGPGPSTVASNSSERLTKVSKVDDLNKKKKDPEAKRPPTAFNIFFSEMYPIVQEQQSNLTFSEASKMVAGLWSGLGQDGKQKYYEKCEQLRNEFNSKQASETTPTKDTPTANSTVPPEVKPPTPLSPTTKSSGRRLGSHTQKQTREKTEGMCMSEGCYNMALPDTERGPKFCSNECVVNHSKILFHGWITQRRLRT